MADPVLGPVTDGDTFKCTLFQRLYGQTLMNVLHYVCSVPGAVPPDRFQVCKLLSTKLLTPVTGIWPQIRTNQSSDLTHTSHRVQFLKDIEESYPFWEEPVNLAGGTAVPAGMSNVALSIEKRGNPQDPTKPRRGIGRMQVGGIPNDTYEAGVFNAPYVAEFANVCEDMVDPVTIGTDTILLPCMAYKGATQWLDTLLFQCAAKDTVRVMNRRTVGRGI